MALLRKREIASAFYFRSPSLMDSEDRLDYVYWHPKFENLITLLTSTKFAVKELSCLVRSPIISGKTPENYIYPMKGVPFLGARNIRNGRINLTNVAHIDESIHNGLLRSSKISAGDILVTMAGAIGRCAQYTEQKEANINQAVARVQPIVDKINPQYLVYYLNSAVGQIQFDRNRHDVNQPNINTTEMGKIKVVRPPMNLQDEIVKQLYDMENKIDTEKDMQEGVFQELRNATISGLGLSVPSVKCDYYIQPFETLGERLDFVWNHPTTHSVKQYLKSQGAISLGDLIENEVDYGINAFGKQEGKMPFVNIEQVHPDGTIHREGMKYLDDSPLDKLLKPNDILICRSRAVGTSAIVTEVEEDFTFGSFILRIRLKENVDVSPWYIVSFINSDLGRIQFKFLQTGSEKFAFTEKTGRGGGNNINTTQLKQLQVILPKKPELQTSILEKIQQLLENKRSIDARLKTMNTIYNQILEKILFATK